MRGGKDRTDRVSRITQTRKKHGTERVHIY